MKFSNFNKAIASQFAKMSKHQLFRVAVDKDTLWDTYLNSFPDGSNPIYRTRTQHDCNCCKQFIRSVGNVVAIIDSKIVSIWKCSIPGEPEYQQVADALAAVCESSTITDEFLTDSVTAGREKTFEQLVSGEVHQWNHFHVQVPRKFVKAASDIPTILSKSRSSFGVFMRALEETSLEDIDTVLELICQKTLYRGEEHEYALTEFRKALFKYKSLSGNKSEYVWSILANTAGSVTNFRNSVIGTLIADLSSGKSLDDAVGAYEAKVAPSNYKRPTALVTKSMIDSAKKTVESLGLASALERRYATLQDITINNVLFADRSTKSKIMNSVFDTLSPTASDKASDKIEEIGIDRFIEHVLPKIAGMEILVSNSHTANLVSLIAPVDPTAAKLFKWDNQFSWSYTGDVADSIKERVKKAGGNVTGEFCCRLAWYNYDDLDFSMVEPDGNKVYFGWRRSHNTGGELDVDMNISPTTRTPVENIFYNRIATMPKGEYTLRVHSYRARETIDVGFDVEIDIRGQVYSFAYDKRVKDNELIEIAKFYSDGKGNLTIVDSNKISSKAKSKQVWNINTEQFVKCNAVMLSPNYWDGNGVGNKHYFFMLDGCRNDGAARGFYNEFLRGELDQHRKVLEVVGAKMRTDNELNQLSGIGFSTTSKNSFVCKVSSSFTRTLKVVL